MIEFWLVLILVTLWGILLVLNLALWEIVKARRNVAAVKERWNERWNN